MKKLLITVCLSGLLSVPSVVLGAEMAGPSLYGSFRTGLVFGSGNAKVSDVGSRWGIKGSHEVSEGLTASYKFEARMDTTNATTAGNRHDGLSSAPDTRDANQDGTLSEGEPNGATPSEDLCPDGDFCAGDSVWSDGVMNGGGRLSYVSLAGGFGTVSLGQIWSATASHYGFAVDPTYAWGHFGGATYRPGNTVSYSSSAGDVSFQIDKITGDDEALEFGASATLGPVGVGLGYRRSGVDESNFTGVALSAGAAGVNLTIGLGSNDDPGGENSDISILHVGGSLGDSGVSYAVQVVNAEIDAVSQNSVVLTNSIGSGASIIFEHLDADVSKSVIGLKVDF